MDSPGAADRLADNWLHAGRLLRSVTHDVNNHFGAILAYAELIALAPGRMDDIATMAKDITAAVRESTAQLSVAAALVSDDLVTVETIHLNELLPRISRLFRFELDKGDAAIAFALPSEVCAFPGVRTRIVRALTHVIRHAADTMGPEENARRIRIRVTRSATGFTIEIEGGSGSGELPVSLAEANEHVRYHRGEMAWVRQGCIRIEIPQDTGVIKGGMGSSS